MKYENVGEKPFMIVAFILQLLRGENAWMGGLCGDPVETNDNCVCTFEGRI